VESKSYGEPFTNIGGQRIDDTQTDVSDQFFEVFAVNGGIVEVGPSLISVRHVTTAADVADLALLARCAQHGSAALQGVDHGKPVKLVETAARHVETDLGDSVFAALERVSRLDTAICLDDDDS